MNPLFFGDSEQPLFGVDHPPRGRSATGRGIVLCAPIGQEYMRAHRAFRSLASRLSRAGHHVFRFDYYGCGDSAGESDAGSPEIWLRNVHVAIDELRESAALERVSLVGLRFGAALAAWASCEREDVDQLVMWDPVIDGARYLEEMLEVATPPSTAAGVPGILGFPLTSAMREGIQEIDGSHLARLRAKRVEVVVSSEEPVARDFVGLLKGEGLRARYEVVPAGGKWNEVDNFGGALVPQEILQAIVQGFARDECSGATR